MYPYEYFARPRPIEVESEEVWVVKKIVDNRK
jgi:hypothetical protein